MTDEHQEFETLIAYIHGELSADECDRIENRLLTDRELCRVYLELAEEEVILAKRANSGDVAQELDERLFGAYSESPNKQSRRLPSLAWAVAIAASVMAVCSINWGLNERGLRLNNPILADGPPPAREQVPKPMDPDLDG
jgi:anti-sigma-K factor RskA